MEKTPSCKYFCLLADEYIEGELTAAEMRELEAHIAKCEECRKEFEELRALKEALRSVKTEVPEGLHSRIMSAIEAEPKRKPQRKTAFFRSAAISAACVMLCLSVTLALTLIPMWRSGSGGEGLPEDPDYAGFGETISEECNTALKSESIITIPDSENIEEEHTSSSEEMPTPEFVPGDTSPIPETTAIAETIEETMAVAETEERDTMAAADETMTPETAPEMQAPSEEAPETMQNDGTETFLASQDAAPEASSAPGGEEITLALLIVSGLLAVASFVAFLISLSSIRNTSVKKDKEDKE